MHILRQRTTRLLVFNAVVFEVDARVKKKSVTKPTNYYGEKQWLIYVARKLRRKPLLVQKKRMIFENSKKWQDQTKTFFVATDNYQ